MMVFGLHAVLSLLKTNPDTIQRLAIFANREDDKIKTLKQLAMQHTILIQNASRKELDEWSANANHQGVIAFCADAKKMTEADLIPLVEKSTKPLFLLILDCVQDPHNLGACLRSADAAGVDAVIVPKDKSVGITPTVTKVASGAVDSVPFIQVTNLARTLGFLKANNVWVYGASERASQSLYTADLRGSIALVLGAEGKGLRRLTEELCDGLLSIPMQGALSSLNVSVATGVFLFEAVRQRALF